MAELLQDLLRTGQDHAHHLGTLPAGAVYTFDRLAEEVQAGQALPPMIKTRLRKVVSLRFGTLFCREVIRQGEQAGRATPSGLERLVAKGMRYAYDVIAYVGVEYYLHGNTLEDIRQELRQREPPVIVPLSSLYDIGGYFLYLFGQLHRRRASQLRALLEQEGKSAWLMDCTQERDSPAFFGILETHYGILLGCWKVATENQTEIAPCLRQAVEDFGNPGRVLHDLGATMRAVCNEVLADVPDGICHFHFARDVGADLLAQPQQALNDRLQVRHVLNADNLEVLAQPQQALNDRLQALKLQTRLHEQRKDQTDYLRKQLGGGEATLVLRRLLAGQKAGACWTATLGREVLLAVHFWILDYAQDGRRQGYPFDPHLLYLHRRLVRAGEALQRLLASPGLAEQLPRCLVNLCERLREYREDAAIVAAANWYEKAHALFGELRQALRLGSVGKTPMSESYALNQEEQGDVKRDMKGLCEKWRGEQERSGPKEKQMYDIVVTHVEKYEGKLFYEGSEKLNEEGDRTTNELEREWRKVKRRCRRHHGNAALKKEMQVLPAEALLVGNLEVPEYVVVVLGSLGELPQRLAEIGGRGESFRSWKAREQPRQVGQLPRSLLRCQNFLAHLLQVCPALPESP
jgi:hypothetical protein